jgi:riboflavin kinase/FMN adenylyltransferase
MLDMGFIHDIRRILALLPAKRQNLLFSATFPEEIRKLASSFMHQPVTVEVARRNTPAELVSQVSHPVDGARKRELLAQAGVDELVEQPFDRAFAQTEPDAFVDLLLATGVATIVVGHDFTYGRERRGTVDTLRTALEQCGVRLHVVPAITVNGLVVSSTKIREFTLEGRVEAAAQLLGRPFDLDGDVVRGVGRGRKLGWPTANIRTEAELLPAVGVYAVRAHLVDAQGSSGDSTRAAEPIPYTPPHVGAAVAGAANLGLNPTFRADVALAGAAGQPPLSLEVHLIDFAQDIYGRRVRVEFVHRLREERRFPGIEALKAQITQDVMQARKLLGV